MRQMSSCRPVRHRPRRRPPISLHRTWNAAIRSAMPRAPCPVPLFCVSRALDSAPCHASIARGMKAEHETDGGKPGSYGLCRSSIVAGVRRIMSLHQIVDDECHWQLLPKCGFGGPQGDTRWRRGKVATRFLCVLNARHAPEMAACAHHASSKRALRSRLNPRRKRRRCGRYASGSFASS
mgnify:CR=1 FL=1